MKPHYLLLFPTVLIAQTLSAQRLLPWRIDGGFTFAHFQQQVKAEVGDPRGERLVNETQFGFMTMGSYTVWRFIDAGFFLQFDRGNRHAARFDGFDPATGRTRTKDKIGGNYSEFWLGPLVRLHWKNVFAEGGWGAVGIRSDGARSDLISTTGDTTGSFTTLPSIAWFAAVGTNVGILEALDLVFRMEYRLRYYDMRGGDPFRDKIHHGTQNITPYLGLLWRF